LEIVEGSALAAYVEPLLVALKRLLKMPVSAPLEVEEVASDIVKEIEAHLRRETGSEEHPGSKGE
jgi:hypothetical protein